jgi:hypothetical protein
MTVNSQLLDAFLKCPTKCWLRSVGEQITDKSFVQWARVRNESYVAAEIHRLISRKDPDGHVTSPVAEDLKKGKWRLATNVLTQTQSLESHIYAVECLPSAGCSK